ncbi:UNKNOWN [Stylonychia lemnae]|uniref:Calcineurin-like phosphoesterase domain-containing protein n=1 Tax=Stylonychia lemnae TaxID=5949 RepID=A0A078AR29_STYLE|nr:UNKNOWN [Stylonychia lemnae]|eukprot:CDW83702.1 UNKNOWN [Stylonychia lemnae]
MRVLIQQALLISTVGFISARQLSLNAEGTFKIVQFSNMFIDNYGTNYAFTMHNVQNVVDDENPDLVVLTGNTVAPLMEDSFTDKFTEAIQYFKDLQIPWISTGGEDAPESIKRDQMFSIEHSIGLASDLHGDTLSLSGLNNPQSSTLGQYTARVPVMTSDRTQVAFNIWILDSQGGYDCDGNKQGKSCINNSTVQWFLNESAQQNKTKFQQSDLAFTTYPLQEYMTAVNSMPVYGHFGQDVCCQAINTGTFDAIKSSNKIAMISAGADAENDFMVNYHGVKLAYGRKSGYGGTRDLDMGARVIKIASNGQISTYIREYDGDIYEQSSQQVPAHNATTAQTACCAKYDIQDTTSDPGLTNQGEIKWTEMNGNTLIQ